MLNIRDHEFYSGNRVREIELNRLPVNAFNIELLDALKQALFDVDEDSKVSAVTLSGNGGVFSAGMDIKETARLSREEITATFQGLKDVTLLIGRSRVPIACAITGNCLGAGAVFSLFCDYRVMSKGRTSFGITEVRGGMTVPPHMLHALSRIVGEHRAQRLILDGKVLDANRAFMIGLVDELVSHQLVVSRALAWCDRMLKLPYTAMSSTRAAARASFTPFLDALEQQPIETRVDQWFDEDLQKDLQKLLKL